MTHTHWLRAGIATVLIVELVAAVLVVIRAAQQSPSEADCRVVSGVFREWASVGPDGEDRGEVIGALGNSGNSDMPHLHFHIMDSPLPLSSNGLPFLIESFTLAGTVSDADLLDCMAASVPCAVDGSDGGAMTRVSPLYRDVLDFGD